MDRIKTGYTRRHGIKSLLGASLLMPGLLSELMAEPTGPDALNPLAPKAPPLPAKAKRVIFLYMTGGVSHIESFDPKPKLMADHGKSMPDGTFLKRPQFAFKQYGQSGTAVSELFPNVGECVDDLCIIRSMRNDHGNHNEALLGIHTGSVTLARPSMGSWISYGLGTVNQNLPSYVVMAPQIPYAGTMGWSSDFLPACHQGTRIAPGSQPIPNLKGSVDPELQEMELGLADYFNSRHFAQRKTDTVLAARIKSFETAFGMQREAPEAFDLSKETDATLKLYGLERGQQTGFGWQCLVGRRLSERGVRFVELIDVGTDSETNWDSHTSMDLHIPVAKNVDKPISGLLKDLKSRGMLEDTLVIWTTEFGRSPSDGNPVARGRGHHPAAYSSWLAGGGVKSGITYGETDEYGMKVTSNMVGIHDFHATVLHLLGFDHTKLTYRYSGRDFRLTDVAGKIVKDILA